MTIADCIFNTLRPFEYVYHNGEQVLYNGEPVIVYT